MSCLADAYVFEKSSIEQEDMRPFVSKQLTTLQDLNQNNYLSPLSFSTASCASNGKMSNFRDAYIEIPLTLVMSSTGNGGAVMNDEATPNILSIKNGFYQIINSFDVKLNGVSIKTRENYEGMIISYRLHSTMNMSDVERWGSTIGYYPDDADTAMFRQVYHGNGIGCTNNNGYEAVINRKTSGRLARYFKRNEGMVKRQEYLMSDSMTFPGDGGLFIPVAEINNDASGKNTVTQTATHIAYKYLATIKLNQLCPFFDTCPLLSNAILEISSTLNQCSFQVQKVSSGAQVSANNPYQTIVGNDDASWKFLPASFVPYGGCTVNPVMVSSVYGADLNIGNGGVYLPVNHANSVLTISLSVQKPILQAHQGLAGTSWNRPATLVIPQYLPDSSALRSYISSPKKTITFEDHLLRPLLSVPAGQQFQYRIGENLAFVKSLLLVPVIAGTANGSILAAIATGVAEIDTTVAAISKFSPIISPFSTVPSTTSAVGSNIFREFTVRLNNVPIQQEPYRTAQQFASELIGERGLNAGLEAGMSSSLISTQMQSGCYAYYMFNLQRREKALDAIKSSVEISGVLQTTVDLDVYAFLIYEKSYEVDVTTSQILSKNW